MNFFGFFRRNARFLSAGILLTFVSSFGQTFFISIFAGEIRAEFGLSHGAWGAIYACGTVASAVIMVWAGGLTDTIRVRVLAVAVLLGLSIACLSMAVLPTVWLLPLVIFCLRFCGQGMASHIATVAMARWFVRSRGKALAIATTGFALGEAILPIVFVALLSSQSWRLLWVVAALLALTILPVVLRLLKEERTPQSIAHETAANGMSGLQWTRREVLRHWLFWLLLPALLGPSAFGTALFFQQVHLAEVKGWEHIEFVALFPVYTTTAVLAMLGSGWLIDRFGTTWLMTLAQLPSAIGFLLMSVTVDIAIAAIGIGLVAVSTGINATLPGAFWAEYYGTRHLGSIKALAAAVMVLGSAIGPGLSGYLIDSGMDFAEQMTWIALWFLIVSAVVGIGLQRARALFP